MENSSQTLFFGFNYDCMAFFEEKIQKQNSEPNFPQKRLHSFLWSDTTLPEKWHAPRKRFFVIISEIFKTSFPIKKKGCVPSWLKGSFCRNGVMWRRWNYSSRFFKWAQNEGSRWKSISVRSVESLVKKVTFAEKRIESCAYVFESKNTLKVIVGGIFQWHGLKDTPLRPARV